MGPSSGLGLKTHLPRLSHAADATVWATISLRGPSDVQTALSQSEVSQHEQNDNHGTDKPDDAIHDALLKRRPCMNNGRDAKLVCEDPLCEGARRLSRKGAATLTHLTGKRLYGSGQPCMGNCQRQGDSVVVACRIRARGNVLCAGGGGIPALSRVRMAPCSVISKRMYAMSDGCAAPHGRSKRRTGAIVVEVSRMRARIHNSPARNDQSKR